MSRRIFARIGMLLVVASLLASVVATPVDAAPDCSTATGQAFIDQGRYDRAVTEFTCVIRDDPTSVDGYRGRMEAFVLLGRYADAVHDGTRFTADVEPAHPDAQQAVIRGYVDRLAARPTDIPALAGMTFARWWFFDYPAAIKYAGQLLDVQPTAVVGWLFRGSSRALHHVQTSRGAADLERALQLDGANPSAHYIVADAYAYGFGDLERAYGEASIALGGGLDTPRVHAILGAALNSFGETAAAAAEIARHFELVTEQTVTSAALEPGGSVALDLVPGRVIEIPIPAVAGQPISIATSSKDYWDTIALLVAPDGTPVLGSDDVNGYFAAFAYIPPASGTYSLRVTFFESVITGVLNVTRG
jgi:tetratricopeptide (TPR) repeat protein